MADDFKDYRRTLESPAENAPAVTPSNTVDLAKTTRALYIGVSGDVKVDTLGGDTSTFTAHPVGYLICRVTRVYATGTTATNILALS